MPDAEMVLPKYEYTLTPVLSASGFSFTFARAGTTVIGDANGNIDFEAAGVIGKVKIVITLPAGWSWLQDGPINVIGYADSLSKSEVRLLDKSNRHHQIKNIDVSPDGLKLSFKYFNYNDGGTDTNDVSVRDSTYFLYLKKNGVAKTVYVVDPIIRNGGVPAFIDPT